jgi:hypothetical protein
MTTKYCRCGYPIELSERWNGLAHVLVFRDRRTGAEISECPGCGEGETAWLEMRGGEALGLKPGALLDEPPKTWSWWTPTERMVAVLNERGEAEYSATLSADDVVCDLCNRSITFQPVPLLWESYAVCADCFEGTCGLSLEEAARRDGIALKEAE